MPNVYLVGNIAGLDYAGATTWRQEAREYLCSAGFGVFDPMRGKESLSNVASIGVNDTGASNRDVFPRDISDLRNSNIMLAYITGGGVGSFVELGMAYERGAYIALVVPPEVGAPIRGEKGLHPFLTGVASEVFATLERAMEAIVDLNPAVNVPSYSMFPLINLAHDEFADIAEMVDIIQGADTQELDSEQAPFIDNRNAKDLEFWEDFARRN